jgi:hypothetical protein
MKKLAVIFLLLASPVICLSQGSGILKDSRKYALIFLSPTDVVRNKDYPDFMKDKIIEFKNGLTKDSAEHIISNSLVLVDSLSPIFTDAYIANGLNINLKVTVDDGSTMETTYGYYKETKVTSYYHNETRPILVPYSDIINVYIRKDKDKFLLEFWTKFYVTKALTKRPYYGANEFEFRIKPGTDEVALIASLLFLCNNIKVKD